MKLLTQLSFVGEGGQRGEVEGRGAGKGEQEEEQEEEDVKEKYM